MDLNSLKGGDILADYSGNAFLLLHEVRFDTAYGVTIPYCEIEILFKSPLSPDISITRLLGYGDFRRTNIVSYKEAKKRNTLARILYGR